MTRRLTAVVVAVAGLGLAGFVVPVAAHASTPKATVPAMCVRVPLTAVSPDAQIQVGYCP